MFALIKVPVSLLISSLSELNSDLVSVYLYIPRVADSCGSAVNDFLKFSFSDKSLPDLLSFFRKVSN